MDYDEITPLYVLQYQRYADDLGFYTRLAQDYGGPVLELGAGTGRVSRAIAQRGLEVVALEPSAEMRKFGRQHTKGLKVQWLEGDMRLLELGRKFPLIIVPFNALMHLYSLEEQDATLAGVVRHLAEGGRLAFDLYNPAHIGPEGVMKFEGAYEEGYTVFLYQEHHPSAQMLITNYQVDQLTRGGAVRRTTPTLTQRYYTRYEVERWLRSFGLEYRLFGGFQKEPFTADSAVMAFEAWAGDASP
ncbi:MAG: methyltransferase domain-containing protein [Meiothermus sp.]|nr:methyltransferase domain-containing protein [Meiothermus sp.]